MKDCSKRMLVDGAKVYNVSIDDGMVELFERYSSLLLEWNEKVNLTAITEEEDIVIKHYIDSLSIIPHVPLDASNFIDIGTGAGFPSIPVKIARKDLDVTMVDSLNKRVLFLEEVIKSLKMEKIRALHGRAEELGQDPGHRELYDVVAARAVASLNVLLEYCLPFVKVGGVFIAMKGSDTDEVSEASKALDVLGGRIEHIHETVLPFSDIKRNIIIIKKFRQTPTTYPRKPGKPLKQPLI